MDRRFQVTEVAGVFPFMVKSNIGNFLVHIDPVKQKVYLTPPESHRADAEQVIEDILAWINKRPPVQVNVPVEVFEAMEQAKDVSYQGKIPGVQ